MDALVAQMTTLVPAEARALLTVLAITGGPLAPKLALQAAGIRRNGRSLVHALRGLNLVRTRDVNGERLLEVYHDRVRQSVREALTPEDSVNIHARILRTFELSGQTDADLLHALALGAGQREAALRYGRAAAERANETFAFERAAQLYRRCIEICDGADVAGLWVKLAVALGHCGRGVQAAGAYLEAAKHAGQRESASCLQMAAAHLLRCGRFEQGAALVDKVLADMDISVPVSERAVATALAWERFRLRVRGMDSQLRAAEDAPSELLARHDLFENLGSVLTQYDPLRASLFQLRGLHCALDAGEPGRLVHALCRVATSASLAATPKATNEAAALLERAAVLARESAPQASGVVHSTRVVASYFLGRHAQAVEQSETYFNELRAEARADTRGNYYRRYIVAIMRIGSLQVLGRYRQSIAELTPLLEEAGATDNRSLYHNVVAAQTLAEEIMDQCGNTSARLDQLSEWLPRNHFGSLHVLHMTAVLGAGCYTRRHAWARAYLDASWERYLRSAMERGTWMAITMHAARARLLLNQYVVEGPQGSLLAAVRRDVGWLRRQRATAAATRIEARLAHLVNGDRDAAIRGLRDTIAQLDALGMVGEVARDRYALGTLCDGDEGRAQRRRALACLAELGVANPTSLIRAHYPELVEGE